MASNKFTTQTPLANNSVKSVIAERVYLHDTTGVAYADPTAKVNGIDTALISGGWKDLGIVAGSKVTLNYTKETRYIETGIERVRRGAYVTQKTAQATFTLEQFDMDVISRVTGLTPTTFAAGKKVHIGQDDLVQKALLFVGTNKVDGKEIHTYCSKAALTMQLQEQDDARVIAVTADLFAFDPGDGIDAFFTLFILN